MSRALYQLLIFSALAALFSACAAPNEPAGLVKPQYFDLESLLDSQVKLLQQQEAGVVKASRQNKVRAEKKTIRPVNWQAELEMFRQAAINRPAWRGEFTADSSVSNTGVKTITYRRKTDSKAPVEYLQVQFLRENPLHISARLSTDNMLFTTSKVLDMRFSGNDRPELSEYSFAGTEKLIFSGEELYALKGEVVP